jgi:hypothetical protein
MYIQTQIYIYIYIYIYLPIEQTIISNRIIRFISFEADCSNDDVFGFVFVLLIITFVSCPVFTTTPKMMMTFS